MTQCYAEEDAPTFRSRKCATSPTNRADVSWRYSRFQTFIRYVVASPEIGFRLLTAAFSSDATRIDDQVVLSQNPADGGGMNLEQVERPRTRSLTLVTLRHLYSYCALG